MKRNGVIYWRDPLFFAAIAAALVYWLAMYLITSVQPDPGWPLREPLRFLYPALIYPVIEEWIFRGFIQDFFHQRLNPWRLGPLSHANILTSVLFTALHFINHPPLWAAAALTPYKATYKVKVSVLSGLLHAELRATEQGYAARHVIVPTGMSRMFASGTIEETSSFSIILRRQEPRTTRAMKTATRRTKRRKDSR